jgi:hypothetical protein
MMRKMDQHEYFTLVGTVKQKMGWGYIIEAYTCGLPIGMFTREQINSIEALRQAGILDIQNKLDERWRKAIDDVAAGRPVWELPEDDRKSVVDVWYRS